MKSLWGLIIALTGLFVIWLWATGRAKSVWADLLQPGSGNATTGGVNTFNPASVNLNLSKPSSSLDKSLPTVGSQSLGGNVLPALWNLSSVSVPALALPTNYIGNGYSSIPQIGVAVPLSQGFGNTPLGKLFGGGSSNNNAPAPAAGPVWA